MTTHFGLFLVQTVAWLPPTGSTRQEKFLDRALQTEEEASGEAVARSIKQRSLLHRRVSRIVRERPDAGSVGEAAVIYSAVNFVSYFVVFILL